jgi:hypothetical protein
MRPRVVIERIEISRDFDQLSFVRRFEKSALSQSVRQSGFVVRIENDIARDGVHSLGDRRQILSDPCRSDSAVGVRRQEQAIRQAFALKPIGRKVHGEPARAAGMRLRGGKMAIDDAEAVVERFGKSLPHRKAAIVAIVQKEKHAKNLLR